jgi:two-component system, OmpR family, sensor kinase
MTWPNRFRDVRTRLLIAVLASLTVGLAVATLGFNLLLAHTTSHNVDTLLRQRVASERALIRVRDGTVVASEGRGDATADSRIWIFQGRRAIEAPATAARTRAAVDSLVGRTGGRFLDVGDADERLLAEPLIDDNGHRVGTIVAGVSVAAYEETRRAAVVFSLAFAAVLLGLVAAAAWWLLRSALRPVAEMTAQAAAWSEHDLDRRFDVGEPHDELTRLAATLNGLLDRLAASLRHERRFSAELSHELRTPLSKVIAEAEVALRRERDPDEYRAALEVTLRNAHHLTRIVETLVTAAQHEASPVRGTADAYDVAQQASSAVRPVAEERRVTLFAEAPSTPVRIGVDGDLAERVLQPVIDNACRYARSTVRIALETRSNRVRFVVSDDGRGVEPDEIETIFDPGVRGHGSTGTSGAGLGLALARRLARAASGEVTCEPNGAGATFVVSLPGA